VVAGNVRRNMSEETCHHQHWQPDLALVKTLGTTHLRYGPPLHRTFTGAGQYDWSFCDQVFAEMQALALTPIVDLVHFGLPDWLGNFQNPEFPDFVAGTIRAMGWIGCGSSGST
jgi:beta-glucosidase/6-phospho-beta-glucosidase/beta-galactosidase